MTVYALGVARLSVLKGKAQTGIERQCAEIERKARELSAELGEPVELIHIAVDRAVSAFKIPPLDRKQLKQWLERTDAYTILLYYRQDRFCRTLDDFMEMVRWAKKNHIRLVSATENLGDPTVHAEQMVPILNAWLSEGESRGTSARVTNTSRHLRQIGRWTGGAVPFGYQAVAGPKGTGWVLRIYPPAAEIIREAVARVLEGEALNAITGDFNARRVPTPRDFQRKQRGQPTGKPVRDADGALVLGEDGEPVRAPVAWHPSALQKILRSDALIGHIRHKGQLVRGPDGLPVQRGEPIITRDEWHHLQAALSTPGRHRVKTRVQEPSLCLGVVFCVLCGAPYYRWVNVKATGRQHSYYRCRTSYRRAEHRDNCPAMPVKGEWLERVTEGVFLQQVGHVEVLEKIVTPGDSHEAELTEISDAITALAAERFTTYRTKQAEYHQLMADLEARGDQLSEAPAAPARVSYRPTGQTYRQMWEATDSTDTRRQLMRDCGFRLYYARIARSSAEIRADARKLGITQSASQMHRRAANLKLAMTKATDRAKLAALEAELAEVEAQRQQLRDILRYRDGQAAPVGVELARRAGLAASGQFVDLPGDDATWQRVLAPARAALLRSQPVS